MKKITDKQRLDWMSKSIGNIAMFNLAFAAKLNKRKCPHRLSVRTLIDTAIRAESSAIRGRV